MTPSAPYEETTFLSSGRRTVARLTLKGIDGRAPPGVEPAAWLVLTQHGKNSPDPDMVRIGRLIALS